nr:PREDICTED: CD2 antigen cytoplasmic tail-binding protein 2 homolog isoform X1 [Bemisia tabaci]
MAKRKFEDADLEEVDDDWKNKPLKPETKHSLDSDEDDDDVDEEKYKILPQDDIEGQEAGGVRQEGDVQITPFNMDEELEDGHFDTDGNFHWKKEKLLKDHWLDNIDWVKIRKGDEKAPADKGIADSDDSESEEEPFDSVAVYKKILQLMKPKETVAGALRRLGGNKSMSASERWKKKKAGLKEEENADKKNVTLLTELANDLLTRTGNMDIYQETYEKISELVNKSEKKKNSSIYEDAADDGLDMYADDFGEKEKAKITSTTEAPDDQHVTNSSGQSTSKDVTSSTHEVEGPPEVSSNPTADQEMISSN